VGLPALAADPLGAVEHDVRPQPLQLLVRVLVALDEQVLVPGLLDAVPDLLDGVRWVVLDLELVLLTPRVADEGDPQPPCVR
jgi:hypothetical protein